MLSRLQRTDRPMRESQVGSKSEQWVTHEYQRSIEVLVVLLNVVRIVLHCLPLVHSVEVEAGIVDFDGLEECPKGILETAFSRRSATETMWHVARTTLDQLTVVGTHFRSFHPFQYRPRIVVCASVWSICGL